MSPTATVLLPVYNAAEYLVESLESLIGQTYGDFTVLAIDDASSDESPRILREFAAKDSRIKIHTQPENRGLVEALNFGLHAASTRYLFRHDADDRAHPRRIADCLSYFEAHPQTVLLGSAIRRINQTGNKIGIQTFPTSDAEIRWQLLFRNPFAHSAVAFDRATAIAAGGYLKSALHAEDYDLWTRLAKAGQVANLPDSLCDYRVHEANISSRNEAEMRDRSVQIGTHWLAHYLGENVPVVNAWKKWRSREHLTAEALRTVTSELVKLTENHHDFQNLPQNLVFADLAWHLLPYLKRHPTLFLNPTGASTLFRFLPSLREWPARRWSTA